MSIRRAVVPRATVPIVIAFLLVASPAGADIYRWVDESGAVHLDDDIENVPETERDSARTFKAKAAPGALWRR